MEQLTIMFSQEQLRILNEALVQLPYWKAAPLIAEINRQIAEQQKPKPEPPNSS